MVSLPFKYGKKGVMLGKNGSLAGLILMVSHEYGHHHSVFFEEWKRNYPTRICFGDQCFIVH